MISLDELIEYWKVERATYAMRSKWRYINDTIVYLEKLKDYSDLIPGIDKPLQGSD